mgnify:FL=1
MNRSLSPRKRREVMDALMKAGMEELAALFVPKKRRGAAPAKERKEGKRRRHAEETSAIRTEVWERSKGRCENCGVKWKPYAHPLELDHALGGAGRRRQRQSVSNTWALCRIPCHRDKTANRPDRASWMRWFVEHCMRKGIAPPKEFV